MKQHFFAILFFILILATVGVVVYTKYSDGELKTLIPANVAPQEQTDVDPEVIAKAASPPPVSRDELQEMWSQIPTIKEIPWQDSAVAQMFRQSRSRACQLLPADLPVEPLPTPSEVSEGTAEGRRMTAFTVGLKVSPQTRDSLPSLSRSQIEGYLEDHLLAIQPIVYVEPNGETNFSGGLNAVFYRKNSPRTSIAAEPMIAESVRNFRVLGVYREDQLASEDERPRTLVLAFGYQLDSPDRLTTVSSETMEYELLFLHLLKDPGPGDAPIAVFATTDGRETFQEIELANMDNPRTPPSVQALIRFEEFTMMGLYPSSPVVTSVHNRVRSSQPVAAIRERLQGLGGTQEVALADLLDELHGGQPFESGLLPVPELNFRQ